MQKQKATVISESSQESVAEAIESGINEGRKRQIDKLTQEQLFDEYRSKSEYYEAMFYRALREQQKADALRKERKTRNERLYKWAENYAALLLAVFVSMMLVRWIFG